MIPLLQCGACQTALSNEALTADIAVCAECGTHQRIRAFSAAIPQLHATDAGTARMLESEAACYFHPRKVAARACDACGRFVCALCDLEVYGSRYCPECLHLRRYGVDPLLQPRVVRYDLIALTLAVLPLILQLFVMFLLAPSSADTLAFLVGLSVFPGIIVTPLAIVVALRYWRVQYPFSHTRRWLILTVVVSTSHIFLWALAALGLFVDFGR